MSAQYLFALRPVFPSFATRGWGLRVLMALLLVTILAVANVGTVHAQVPLKPRFCYAGYCYSTLSQAEAHLRSTAGSYGNLWTKVSTRKYMDSVNGPVFVIQYEVEDQEPSVLYAPGYVTNSRDAGDGICAANADPFAPERCADEDEGVVGAMALLRSTFPSCTFVEGGYEGNHGAPYVSVRQENGYGQISFLASAAGAERKYSYTIWCPGWGVGYPPETRKMPLNKIQNFTCPSGFRAKYANNPIYLGYGPEVDWPRLCQPTATAESIYAYNTSQNKSCPANSNPCFPATGDKARTEVDFAFAGREFSRHYHSLGQFQAGPDIGTNWTHTFADTLARSSGDVRISNEGYLHRYSSGRGMQVSSEQLKGDGSIGFELVDGSGSKRKYDGQGRLIAIDDGVPQTSVSLSYDSNGRLDRVTDSGGRVLKFTYDHRKISSITLPDGSRAEYFYDRYSNLTKVIRPDGSSRTYVYSEVGLAPADSPNLLTGIVEGDTRYATFSYGADDKVTGSQLFAEGQAVDVLAITYNEDGTATSVNNLGDVRQHAIGGGQFPQITRTEDALGVHSYAFNDSGRMASKLDPLGNRTTIAYADFTSGAVSQVVTRTEESIGRITRTTRDTNNRVVEDRVTQKVGGVEQLASLNRTVPDAQGRPLYACQYDANQPTDYVCGSLALAPSNVRQTQNLYCTEADVAANPAQCPLVGLHLSTRDPAGNLTQFEYYAANDPGCDAGTICTHRKGDLRAQINAIGQRTEILEYDASGNAIRIQAIDGTETERLYDSMGRMVTETLKGDVPANDRISLFEYSSTGKMTKSTGPDGVWTRMHYDTADRLTSVEDALGNRIVYTLDGAGNRVKEEIRDAAGTLRKVMTRGFDTVSRNTRIAGADGYATLMRYDGNGNALESENALGTITKQTYDGADRVLTEVQDLGGINAQVGYEYAISGQIAAVTDPKGLRTTYGYNGFGDQISLISPDTGTTTFTVDANGNRKTKTDARGITATYYYDALNRMIGTQYPDPNLDVGYVYDTAPDVCAANERFGVGRLGYVQHEGGSTAYCYDRFGQLTRKVQTVNGVATTVRYGYTPGGQLAQLTYPDGSVADYQRDALGRIGEVGVIRPGQARQVVVTNVAYAPFGPATRWTYGNGRALQRPVDQDYRPIAVSDPAAGGLSMGFGYDEVGAINQLKNAPGTDVLAQYAYDALGRLTETQDGVTGTPIETYDYDATGNRIALTTSAGTQDYTYPANNHRLTAVDGRVREYDVAGNNISIGDREFTYSDANRMSQVKNFGEMAESYTYNHLGERVGRTPTGQDSKYTVYDEAGQWLADYTDGGQVQQQAIWMDGFPVALISADSQGANGVSHVQPDHLGTPRAVIDPIRDISVWEWSGKSEVFGNQVPNDDPDGDGQAFLNRLRFPGQQFVEASGLNYNYQREYDPASGRYVQSDPMGFQGGISTYSYVEQSPLMAVDPKGLFSIYAYQLYNGQWRFRFDFHQACFLGDSPVGHLDRGFQRIPYLGKVRKKQVEFERPTGDADAVNKCACRAFDSELKAMFLSRGWTTGDRYGGGAYDEATANKIISAFRDKVRKLNSGGDADCERCEIPWDSLIPKAKSRGAQYIGNGVY